MWILTPLQPGGETHYLLSSKEYVVGRKNCDILLANDQSISRAHARLTATDQTLTLKDSSKYGTFINSQQVAENADVSLTAGDNITFGVYNSKFKVDHVKPVVCSSCLDNDDKASLSQAMAVLGGKLVNTWSQDCTHLVMTSAKVTIKTICALLCCRPIVKPEFFSEFSRATQQKSLPPKAESFIPEMDEPSLNQEDVNLGEIPARRHIFSGKTFTFLNAKQQKRLSAAVSFGGGRSQLLEEGSLPRELLESPHNCVIDVTAGSSQALLPSSTTEWAKSVKNILQRKGLRVIPESEIGLAAIYASCDQYCNPSNQTAYSAPKVNPRIPSASLSQSLAVEETVLPAASQNITAYVVNTEPSQRIQQSTVTGVASVCETPEKKPNPNPNTSTGQHRARAHAAQKTDARVVVENTMRLSCSDVQNTDSQRKKAEPKPSVSAAAVGPKTFRRPSPQKAKSSAQTSPQKQSTLTSFFQPANKKRPLEDDSSAVASESKRPVLESSGGMRAPDTSVTSRGAQRLPVVTSAASQESAADLFVRESAPRPGASSKKAQEEPRSRKRKEMDEEIDIDELESLMSEDFFDEAPAEKGQPAQAAATAFSLTEKKQAPLFVGESSSSKKQRVHLEEPGSGATNSSRENKQPLVSIKTEPVRSPESRALQLESSKPLRVETANSSLNILPFEDNDDGSLIEDEENADICLPEQESKTALRPLSVKQEVKEQKVDDDLPKNLLLVEFRSLSVAAQSKGKPQRPQEISFAKNFKCFRKRNVPGGKGSPDIIGGSDLLVHNRGKNSDLDEWLKDAAEEERQHRQEESIGDNLFRYNPSKLSKRR
ncbi:nibrin [Nelusetta ayraudi]|uniref:nibrin n=1 Tax=Nelusetta ayraudi TaxID=303726 RepID=UPI003F7159F7